MRVAVRFVLFSFVLTLLAPIAHAQYFGRNKVQWESFDFKVLQTEHFDIYYYDQEADVVHDVARMSERWYARLSRVFDHSFNRKPIVLYANSADFHQTTTTGGQLGEGTGGFTDSFMNRVVLPLTGDYAQNDHVLGHEMVHVFQYDIASTANRQRRRFALEALPLWLIEGMAEYFSKGRVDPLTSMWIRDATIHDRMPNIRELTRDSRYFPYRYGQALMAYIGARFGDEAVVRYFQAAGVVGPEDAVERALGISHKQLFSDWEESSRELYNPILETRRTREIPGPLVGRKPAPPPAAPAADEKERRSRRRRRGASELNIGPALSSDGRYIAFLSARELFSIDLFLADAKTGKIIRKLVSSDRDPHFESLRFIESAGAWSPDNRRLAFITFSKGDNFLSFVDVETRRTEHVKVPGLEAIINVAWSPDGRTVALAGQTTGVSDLFLYDVESKEVRRLTADKYADLQPSFSPDGKSLVFATDRGSDTILEQLRFTNMRLAVIDIATGQIREINAFQGAKHINPQWAPDGRAIYFIANPEGIPDVYRISYPEGQLAKVTSVGSGVAGITDMSPALTVASRTGEIAFSMYEDDNYNLYTLPAGTTGTAVAANLPPAENTAPRAALLPPLRGTGSEITGYLMRPEEGLPPASATFQERDYSANLHLAYLGPPTLGVGISEFGTGAGGSVTAYFSDILGQQNVGFTFQGGGGSGTSTIGEQLGGELFYLNQKHRLNWGADLLHVPTVYGAAFFEGRQNTPDGPRDVYVQQREVQLYSDLSLLSQYPFSTTRRIEGSVGSTRYSYKVEEERFFFEPGSGRLLDREKTRIGDQIVWNFQKASAAFVGDSSVYGFISPINGTRYRYEIETLHGDLNFQTVTADWRRYFFFRPMTVAIRGLHYGRYGDSEELNQLSPLYLGRGSLMRGYDPYSIDVSECNPPDDRPGLCPALDRLVGSRLALASIELRAPLLGTREFGLINAAFLPTEIYAFGDAGGAWAEDDPITWEFDADSRERVPVFSVGVGVRILLSYIPIEFFAAKPFQRPDEDIVYGFNIAPGW